MGNIYSAQNVAAYFIYELNEQRTFINAASLQYLLTKVEEVWREQFGHSAFREKVWNFDIHGYIVKEVADTYEESGIHHLFLPAKDWFLQFGQFQLQYKTYSVPAFTNQEQDLINRIVNEYLEVFLSKAS
ncbi:hypothetical protein D1B33_11930 [Lysinibacillus yapensis]|uniref:Uncharacterized protein n=1 Tax=Ureibacillus yapensis TaxID=2304605 RepID=A0A396S9J2_9BACL|nr:hypothetical protein [Lysinibacillus yapensis]RHW35805.1 hypothetical protein D1B33_11930 [Lysinibacillus yapensis]